MSKSRSATSVQPSIPLLLPICVVFVLEVAVWRGWVTPSQWVAPHRLWHTMWSRVILESLGWTFYRLIAGVALGTLSGVLSGLFLSQYRFVDRLLSQTLGALSAIPIIIWLPFLTPHTGLGDWAKICFVAVGTFFLVHMHCYHSAREEDRAFTELTQVYECSLWQRLTYVVIPASVGEIVTGIRLSVALGWVVISYAEFDLQDAKHPGIGQYIFQSRMDGRIEEMFAGMLILAITGTLMDQGLGLLERKFRSWANDSMHNE